MIRFRMTLIREREAEVRDPDTEELIETFLVPDDLDLTPYVRSYTLHPDDVERPDDD